MRRRANVKNATHVLHELISDCELTASRKEKGILQFTREAIEGQAPFPVDQNSLEANTKAAIEQQ